MGRMLGAGAFGAVYAGEWMHAAVVTKQMHVVASLMGEAEEEFKKEMSLMAVRRAATTQEAARHATPQPPPSCEAPRLTSRSCTLTRRASGAPPPQHRLFSRSRPQARQLCLLTTALRHLAV